MIISPSDDKKKLLTALGPQAILQFLHVEDDDGDAKILQRAFAKEFDSGGYHLQRARSLNGAMAELRHGVFDAVLLDLGLGDTSGLGGLNAIRDANPDLPIVILSGQGNNDIAMDGIRGGAQEYVVKGDCSSRMLALSVLSSIERKKYERYLFKLANHDTLTGLPNRRMFQEYIKHWLIRADRWQRTEAVMFIDVNGFKSVNDDLGHDIGDELLLQIAARLKVGLRASDMLARYGGDEFVVHLDMGADVLVDTCAQVAEKISAMFVDPICIGGHKINTGVSIGIALYPENGRDSAELIQKADEAMYRAKRNKEKFSFAI